jgi:hypothetical protein
MLLGKGRISLLKSEGEMVRNGLLIAVVMALTPSYAYARGEGESLVYGLGVIVVAILIFLVGREVVCWYWKINEGIRLLKEIRDILKSQFEPNNIIVASSDVGADEWKCKCGYINSNSDEVLQ